jgi:DNA invertase Pin-like site-specific DNA recombinase
MMAYSYVRWSSPEQARGDSPRRQATGAEAYCRKRGWTLDTSLKVDDGVSAYRGKNARQGALKAFLDRIADGSVKPGDALIVENVDRISRQGIDEGYDLCKRILKSGVRIVTLYPERDFGPEAVKGLMKGALGLQILLELAAEESRKKAERLSAAWGEKKRLALAGELQPSTKHVPVSGKAMTGKVPGWIVVKEDRTFGLDAKKAKTVRRIFELCLAGRGSQAIANLLNREKVPHVSRNPRATYWHDGPIYKLLTDRRTVGEWTPMVRGEDGKRRPAGEPLKDYFPPVVDDKLFWRVQEVIDSRSKVGFGSQDGGWGCSNVFRGLVQSPEGHTYTFRCRNGHDYLVCKNGHTGEAEAVNIPYRTLEKVLLAWLGSDVKVELTGAEVDLAALRAEQADLERRWAKVLARAKETAADEWFVMADELKAELQAVSERVEKASVPRTDRMTQTRSLIRQLDGAEDKDGFRQRLRQQLRLAVRRIVVESAVGRARTSAKKYALRVELADGQQFRVGYETDGKGKVIKYTIHVYGKGAAKRAAETLDLPEELR